MTPHDLMANAKGIGNGSLTRSLNKSPGNTIRRSLSFTAILLGSIVFFFLFITQASGEPIDPETLSYADPDLLGDHYLYVTNEGEGGGGETLIYISENGTGSVVREDLFGPSGLALFGNSTTMYTSDDLGSVYSLTLHGILDHVHERTLDNPNGLAFDDRGRLLIADAGSRILRTNLTSGETEVLAEDFMIPQAIVCDGDIIYFTDHSGFIFMIPPDAILPVNSTTVHRMTENPVVFGTQGGMVMTGSGDLLVSDYHNGLVIRVEPDGSAHDVAQFTNCYTRGLLLLHDDSTLLVTSYNTNQIFALNMTSGEATVVADNTTTMDLLNGPFGMILSRHNFLYGVEGEDPGSNEEGDGDGNGNGGDGVGGPDDGDNNLCECPGSPEFDMILPLLDGSPVSSDDGPFSISSTNAFNLTITVRNSGEEINSFIILPFLCDYELLATLPDTGSTERNGTDPNNALGFNVSYIRELFNGTAGSPWNVSIDSMPIVQGIPPGMCGHLNVSVVPEGPVSGDYFLLIVAQSIFNDVTEHIGVNLTVRGSEGDGGEKPGGDGSGEDQGTNIDGSSPDDGMNEIADKDDDEFAPVALWVVILSIAGGLCINFIRQD